jgi:hypothetical protein
MFSRRNFLMSLLFFVPALLAPSMMFKRLNSNPANMKKGKFVRQGWMLREGDV